MAPSASRARRDRARCRAARGGPTGASRPPPRSRPQGRAGRRARRDPRARRRGRLHAPVERRIRLRIERGQREGGAGCEERKLERGGLDARRRVHVRDLHIQAEAEAQRRGDGHAERDDDRSGQEEAKDGVHGTQLGDAASASRRDVTCGGPRKARHPWDPGPLGPGPSPTRGPTRGRNGSLRPRARRRATARGGPRGVARGRGARAHRSSRRGCRPRRRPR